MADCGAVVGALLIGTFPGGDPPAYGPWLIDVFRTPGYRGVGRALLTRALVLADYDTLGLIVTEGNDAARRLYEALDFDARVERDRRADLDGERGQQPVRLAQREAHAVFPERTIAAGAGPGVDVLRLRCDAAGRAVARRVELGAAGGVQPQAPCAAAGAAVALAP